jgi:hypothetical protein
MVGCDEEVAELGMTGYGDMKRQILDVLDSGDDDKEKKRGFLMKNEGWISLGEFWGVLWV